MAFFGQKKGPNSHYLIVRFVVFALLLVSSSQLLMPGAKAQPSLSLEIEPSASDVALGDLLGYTLRIANTGSDPAKWAWLNDTIPNGTSYISSVPACDSFMGNTCTWVLSDLTPGTIEIHLVIIVEFSLPGDFVVENNATLDYTDSAGVPLGSVSSDAQTIVHSRYLSLTTHAETYSTTPNDFFEFEVLIGNPSPFTCPYVWVNVSFPPEVLYISDNATNIGATRTGDHQWELRDVTQGSHEFGIITRISPDVVNRQQLSVDVQLNHTDKDGLSYSTIRDRVTFTIQSPNISQEIIGGKSEYRKGDTASVFIYLENIGSVPAKTVWANLTVPSSVRYLDDTSTSVGAIRSGDTNYVFSGFDTGSRGFMVHLDLENVEGPSDVEVWFFLNYTDSNGDLVGESQQRLSFIVTAPSEEAPSFPLVPVLLVALLACILSFAAAISRESSKYSILMFLLPLYIRLKREDVLDNEIRGMIRGYIVANPGDHFNSIKAALDLKNGALAHHLYVLEREKIVKSVKDGKYRRVFPAGAKVSEKAYPTKIERLILAVVKETPGIAQKDIVKHLGLSQPTVSYHIDKLKKSKRIAAERHGMSIKHYIEDSRG